MKAILLKVKTPNKMLFLKGKLSRTPFEAIIKSSEELRLIKTYMQLQNVEYNIEPYVEVAKNPAKSLEVKKVSKIKQPEKTEAKTILEKISNE